MGSEERLIWPGYSTCKSFEKVQPRRCRGVKARRMKTEQGFNFNGEKLQICHDANKASYCRIENMGKEVGGESGMLKQVLSQFLPTLLPIYIDIYIYT